MRLVQAVLSAGLVLSIGGGDARAQDEGEGDATPATAAGPTAPATSEPAKAEWGIGVRLREIFVPKGEIELFMAEAASGVSHPGFGLEAVRRKGNFELALGVEYENTSPKDGWFLQSGDDGVTPGQFPDFVEFSGFSWLAADVTFVFHHAFTEQFALRYGGGFGVGIVNGKVLQSDSTCTSRDIQHDCTVIGPGAGQYKDPASLPPIFPVVDAILGVQFRPTKKIEINLEGGLHTVFYGGLGATYFF